MSAFRRVVAGIGGIVLIGALLLPWTETGAVTETGWDLVPGPALVCVIAGLAAIGTALTGGRITFFRPDVSLTGAADMFSVASSLMIGWLAAVRSPGRREPAARRIRGTRRGGRGRLRRRRLEPGDPGDPRPRGRAQHGLTCRPRPRRLELLI